MPLFILLYDASPIASDKMLCNMVCRLYRNVLRSISVPMSLIPEGLSFAEVSDDALDNIFVFVLIVLMSQAGCTLLD